MNKKGFTLIELLAVIILVALIGVLVMPTVINTTNQTKQKSYDILIKNIVTSAQTYYEECEYGDLSNNTKYGSYACNINNNTITITLGTLANTGFLSVKDVDSNNKKKVLNPKNNYDISECNITITKTKNEVTDENGIKNNKVTYTITAGTQNNCPTTEEYKK
mgnify:FL=1